MEVYTGYARVGGVPSAPPQGQAELYVLHLHHEYGQGGLRIDNEKPDDPVSPDVYRCVVRNIGSKAVHEVLLDFPAAFFRGPKPEGSSRTSQRYAVSVPRLAPDGEFVFYVRNDSPFGALLDIPDKAAVRNTPGGDTVAADLKWDAQNISSELPVWGLHFNGATPAPGRSGE